MPRPRTPPRAAPNGGFEADMPLSAILRAEIAPDGSMLMGEGRILAGAGFIGDRADPQSRILVGNPMQSIKRDCEIKLIVKGKTTSVSNFESKISEQDTVRCRQSEALLCEFDHVVRRIDAHYRTPRYARSDFSGDLAVAAANIEDPLRTIKVEQSKDLLSHRCLQRRNTGVPNRVPFCHMR